MFFVVVVVSVVVVIFCHSELLLALPGEISRD